MPRISAVRVWLPLHSSSTRRMCVRSMSSKLRASPMPRPAPFLLQSEVLIAQARLWATTIRLHRISTAYVAGQLYCCNPFMAAGETLVIRCSSRWKTFAKMIDQRRNIFPALAQRRNLDVEDIQAIVKIGTKLAFPQSAVPGPCLVAGRCESQRFDGLIAAHAHDLALSAGRAAGRSGSSG